MALLEWTDALSAGLDEIDDDHKHLLGILNRLNEAISDGNEDVVVGELLEELLDYTVWHFRHEERLMQMYGDPSFFEHKQKHAALTEAAIAKRKAYLAGDANVPGELMPFLKAWLTEHIQGTDAKTGRYIAAHLKSDGVRS